MLIREVFLGISNKVCILILVTNPLHMEKTYLYHYYSFGYNYNNLLDGIQGKSNLECFQDIKRYSDFIRKHDLKVTISSIKLKGLTQEFAKLEKLAKSKKTREEIIDEAFWTKIVDTIEEVDSTLDAELNTKIGYILDEKRFSNEVLTSRIGHLFSQVVFPKLPTIALFDFEESGKCLAFDRYTACAFHALRGTEDVLKMYYEKSLSLKPTEKDTWGTYETAINNAVASGSLTPPPEEQLIINITSLRKYYRNKTQHPQLIYSSDEAQDLLSLCIKTVNELLSDLIKRRLI
jgi:hypothetical protein